MSARRLLPFAAASALAVLPGVAQACSTCMDPTEGNRALLWVTIILSLLPLGMLAAIGGYLWSRSRAPTPAPALPLDRP